MNSACKHWRSWGLAEPNERQAYPKCGAMLLSKRCDRLNCDGHDNQSCFKMRVDFRRGAMMFTLRLWRGNRPFIIQSYLILPRLLPLTKSLKFQGNHERVSIAKQAGSNVRLKGSRVSKSTSSPFMCFYSPSFLSHTLCDYNRIINSLYLEDRESTQKSPTTRTCSGLLESASIR